MFSILYFFLIDVFQIGFNELHSFQLSFMDHILSSLWGFPLNEEQRPISICLHER